MPGFGSAGLRIRVTRVSRRANAIWKLSIAAEPGECPDANRHTAVCCLLVVLRNQECRALYSVVASFMMPLPTSHQCGSLLESESRLTTAAAPQRCKLPTPDNVRVALVTAGFCF